MNDDRKQASTVNVYGECKAGLGAATWPSAAVRLYMKMLRNEWLYVLCTTAVCIMP